MNPLALFEIGMGIVGFFQNIFASKKQEEVEQKQKEWEKTSLEVEMSTLDTNIDILKGNIEGLKEEMKDFLGSDLYGGRFGKEVKKQEGQLTTSLAASGVKLGTGTAEVAKTEFIKEAEWTRDYFERTFNRMLEEAETKLSGLEEEKSILEDYYNKHFGEKKNKAELLIEGAKEHPMGFMGSSEMQRIKEQRKEEQYQRQREEWQKMRERRQKKREEKYRKEMNILGVK